MNSSCDQSRGIWFDNIERKPPFAPADTSNVYWWLQSYGIFVQLHLYNLTGEEHYLDLLRRWHPSGVIISLIVSMAGPS